MNVIINFDAPVKQYGNSVALATVTANSENQATSLLDNYLAENHPELGRMPNAHFEEDGKYYFAVTE